MDDLTDADYMFRDDAEQAEEFEPFADLSGNTLTVNLASGAYAYIASRASGTLTVFDTVRNVVTGQLPTGTLRTTRVSIQNAMA